MSTTGPGQEGVSAHPAPAGDPAAAGAHRRRDVAGSARDSGHGNRRVRQHLHDRGRAFRAYGVNGVAIDQDDVRAHGKDERVRVSAFYDGVEFYYRYLKALTSRTMQ